MNEYAELCPIISQRISHMYTTIALANNKLPLFIRNYFGNCYIIWVHLLRRPNINCRCHFAKTVLVWINRLNCAYFIMNEARFWEMGPIKTLLIPVYVAVGCVQFTCTTQSCSITWKGSRLFWCCSVVCQFSHILTVQISHTKNASSRLDRYS